MLREAAKINDFILKMKKEINILDLIFTGGKVVMHISINRYLLSKSNYYRTLDGVRQLIFLRNIMKPINNIYDQVISEDITKLKNENTRRIRKNCKRDN